ncbi:MAG: PKD domain-containing protein, partial [Acidimicrobiales bacterium]
TAIRNTQENIRLEDHVSFNVVTDNLIANNARGGVKVDQSSSSNVIARNRIGLLVDGSPSGNEPYGVKLEGGASRNVVGPDNTIAGSVSGVQVSNDGTVGNAVTRNSIAGNSRLAIDIGPLDSVNPNDPGDVDDGPNRRLNWPVVTAVGASFLAGTACSNCTIETFLADGDVGQHGEIPTFLASAATDAGGGFLVVLPAAAAGQIVTATATDPEGNTSEVGANTLIPLPSPGNQPPTARFTATCFYERCTFDGSPSSDPDGSVVGFDWDFGDGAEASGASVIHYYDGTAAYPVTLTVTDDDLATDAESQIVSVSLPPADVFAIDDFSRTVTAGWGAEHLGTPYVVTGWATGDFSVTGDTGRVTIPTAGLRRDAALASASELDIDLTVGVTTDKTPDAGNLMASLVARRVAPNTEYRARARVDSAGRIWLGLHKLLGTSTEQALTPDVQVSGLTFT